MDGNLSVSPSGLYARLGTSMAPMLVDVRRKDAFEKDDRLIVGALRRAPEDVGLWSNELDRLFVGWPLREGHPAEIQVLGASTGR